MALARVEELAVRSLARLAGRFRGASAAPRHLQTGLRGEQEALFYLRRMGYTVVARQWTSAKVRGDLDLVAWSGGTLCFVEVKSRTARDAVAAETAVDRAKRLQLRLLAAAYLKGFAEEQRARIFSRFDVVSVYLLETGVEFELLQDAFAWDQGYEREDRRSFSRD